MHRYRNLTVGLSRTDTDVGLIHYAALVARLAKAHELRFVHILPRSADPLPPRDQDRVQTELQAAVQPQLTGLPGTTQVCYDVLAGPLTDRLLAFVVDKQTDLLFVGHRRNHPGRGALARRLAMKAPCSVWMVPDDSPVRLERILVPVDFSEHAADTLRVATSLARLGGQAHCLALHVYFNEAVVTYEEYDQVLRGQEQQAYEQFIAAIDCQGVSVSPLFEEGANVAHVIQRVADQHGMDLIVMATRGRSRSAAILLGSVTEDAIIDTRVPLLVVKHFGARLGLLQVLLDQKFHHQGRLHTD